MSADNGIYIAHFPNGEMRVSHAFDSVINELDTHWYSAEDARDAIMAIFDGPVFTDSEEAYAEARRLEGTVDYTEYGICHVQFKANYGELRGEITPPQLPDGACKHCSDVMHENFAFHAEDFRDCRDPNLPQNFLVRALRNELPGCNEYRVVNVILDTLEKAGYRFVKEG